MMVGAGNIFKLRYTNLLTEYIKYPVGKSELRISKSCHNKRRID